jgi:hypothetical protein
VALESQTEEAQNQMTHRVGNAAASLRVVDSNVSVSLPDDFGQEMEDCYFMHDLACGAIDRLGLNPALKDNTDIGLALFAFYEAKRRFDELYEKFAKAEVRG